MSLVIYQNYSNNNYELMKTTLQNHVDYCNKHQYSFILDNAPYSPFINIEKIKGILNAYDYVATIGSDCIITDFEKNFENFLPENKCVGISIEGLGFSTTNGQIIIFKNDERLMPFFDLLDKEQKINANEKWGTQSCFNKFIQQNRVPECVELIPVRALQSFYSNLPYVQKCIWKKGDFICHCIDGSNQDKLNRCKQFLSNNLNF